MPAQDTFSLGSDHRLIETLRWEAETGFIRLDRHLTRMARSALTLGFAYDQQTVRNALVTAAYRLNSSQARFKITLAANGAVEITTAPLPTLPLGTVWRVAIARLRLRSTDLLLRHKTTRRAFYDNARADAVESGIADEVIFLNERSELCEGSITNIFVRRNGLLLTPPLSSGLLPGCLREELLATGKAEEAVLDATALRRASEWYVGNSLRGLIPARLVDPATSPA